MKKILLIISAITMAMAAQAEEANDTTFIVNDKKIVVSDTLGKTDVKVYADKGKELSKTREATFVDGQEIEQVYITSPFLPQRRKQGTRRYHDHIPDIFFGGSVLAGGIGGFKGAAGLHTKSDRSYTWGLTAFGMGIPFNAQRTFGVTTAIQAGYTRHLFNPDYAMFNVDGHTMMLPLPEDEGAKKSYVSYWYMRLPVIFEWQKHVNGNEAYAGIGVSIEQRTGEHSRYKKGKSGTITPTSDLNMNPFGLNLEMHMGYGGIVFSLRTALTPLFNTSAGPKCYPVSFTMGIKLPTW